MFYRLNSQSNSAGLRHKYVDIHNVKCWEISLINKYVRYNNGGMVGTVVKCSTAAQRVVSSIPAWNKHLYDKLLIRVWVTEF